MSIEHILNYNFDDFGHEHDKSIYLRGKTSFDPYQGRSQYVPYFPARSSVPASLNGILESKERIYLKHRPYKELSAKDAKSDISSKAVSEEEEYQANTYHLDLGVEPLRKVLFDMKKLGGDSTSRALQQHDPYAIRNSGLPRYTSYIHDTSFRMREHQHTIKKLQKGKKQDNFIR